jgi:hypothetical protein
VRLAASRADSGFPIATRAAKFGMPCAIARLRIVRTDFRMRCRGPEVSSDRPARRLHRFPVRPGHRTIRPLMFRLYRDPPSLTCWVTVLRAWTPPRTPGRQANLNSAPSRGVAAASPVVAAPDMVTTVSH